MKTIAFIIIAVVLFNTNPNRDDFIAHIYNQIESIVKKNPSLSKEILNDMLLSGNESVLGSKIEEKNYYIFSVYTIDTVDKRFSKPKDNKTTYIGIAGNFIRLGSGPIKTVLDNIQTEQLERMLKDVKSNR